MTCGHFPPVSEECHIWLWDIFLPFLKSETYDYGTFSSHFWKVSHMTNGHFPPIYKKVSHMTMGHFHPVSEKCHTWLVDIFLPFLKSVTYDWDNFLPFLKSVTYDNRTFSSHFWKVSNITCGHFPPVYKKCQIWLVDIFLLFLKSVTHH